MPPRAGSAISSTENDEECLRRVRELLSFLPTAATARCRSSLRTDSAERECPELDTIIPDKANRSYDMKKIIAAVADNGELFEPHEFWAKNMVVAFIRIMGRPVGVIANNPRFVAGVLDVTPRTRPRGSSGSATPSTSRS